jgi:phosphatidate cytidylyltransferase
MWLVVALTLVCAPLSVLGDLFASLIKRQCHVKDFGKIMPGHGGIMDRFDSLLLVVPLLYIFVHFMPLVQ